jgi:iron complex outermembrane receptor protein
VNEEDKALKIPRGAPKSYGASLDYRRPLWSFAVLSSRVSYAHRDKNFFTYSNIGFIDGPPPAAIIFAAE